MYLPTRLPEVETRDPVALTLLRAAQVIREKGWCQGHANGLNGGHCIWGAVVVARGTSHGIDTSEEWLALKPVTGHAAIEWNDTPGRTAAEVISALEAAALSRVRGV